MLQIARKAVCVSLLIFGLTNGIAVGADTTPTKTRTAILLASLGTAVPSAVQSIAHISEQDKKAYPETEVRISFSLQHSPLGLEETEAFARIFKREILS